MERVFPGKDQLPTALRPLVEAADRTLGLDEAKRQRTILRIDSGGGSVDMVVLLETLAHNILVWARARSLQINCRPRKYCN